MARTCVSTYKFQFTHFIFHTTSDCPAIIITNFRTFEMNKFKPEVVRLFSNFQWSLRVFTPTHCPLFCKFLNMQNKCSETASSLYPFQILCTQAEGGKRQSDGMVIMISHIALPVRSMRCDQNH